MGSGFIYGAVGEGVPGIVKIGRTSTSVAMRLRNLSMGVPWDYSPAFAIAVVDDVRAEILVHKLFADHRLSPRKELFRYHDNMATLAEAHLAQHDLLNPSKPIRDHRAAFATASLDDLRLHTPGFEYDDPGHGPPVTRWNAVDLIDRNAYLSLHSVLYVEKVIHASVATYISNDQLAFPGVDTIFGHLFFQRLPEKAWALAREATHFQDPRTLRVARPERALCDWLCIVQRDDPYLDWPPIDIRMDCWDHSLLREIAAQLGVGGQLGQWLLSVANGKPMPNPQVSSLKIKLGRKMMDTCLDPKPPTDFSEKKTWHSFFGGNPWERPERKPQEEQLMPGVQTI